MGVENGNNNSAARNGKTGSLFLVQQDSVYIYYNKSI